MTNSNRRDWNELSYEILVTILMFLNVGDIAAASMVNKIWNKACHDPSLWHTLDLSIRSSYFLPKKGDFTKVAVDMAMKLWVSLESITLTSVVSRHDIFPTILEYCKKITEMKFSCGYIFDVKHSEAMAKCTPNLKVLSIRVIVATMTALCCVLTSLEHLEDRGTVVVGIRDIQNHLPPSSVGKLIYCEEGKCLRCKNGCDTTPIWQPYGPLRIYGGRMRLTLSNINLSEYAFLVQHHQPSH
ncbi:hypothetical protein GYH30_026275 [Glycine max]|nr:hypothetical protein JHK86_026405 [Glycine max]KAH1044964.1 hypothetical protein GYH30_026275 [Glycine max]